VGRGDDEREDGEGVLVVKVTVGRGEDEREEGVECSPPPPLPPQSAPEGHLLFDSASDFSIDASNASSLARRAIAASASTDDVPPLLVLLLLPAVLPSLLR